MSLSFSSPPPRDARARGAGVTAVLGPTNTGKTHLAIERMLAHSSGLIGLPLRLLAREVYNKVVDRVGVENVALITGDSVLDEFRHRERTSKDHVVDVHRPRRVRLVRQFRMKVQLALLARKPRRRIEESIRPTPRPLFQEEMMQLVQRHDMADGAYPLDGSGQVLGQRDR